MIHLDHVVGLHVGEQDHQLVLAGGVLQPPGQRPDGQPVPVAAGGEVIEDPLIFVGLKVVPVAGHHRVAAERAEGGHPHRDMAAGQALGDHVALGGHHRLPVDLGAGGVQQDVHRQFPGVRL